MENTLIWVILGMAAVTFIPRMIPMVFLADREVPQWVNEWLGYIPVAVLAALLFPSLFIRNDQIAIIDNSYLFAAVPTFIIGLWTKNIFATVLTGMISVVLFRLII